jgi:LPXTG-motif cell wall-anchored protein
MVQMMKRMVLFAAALAVYGGVASAAIPGTTDYMRRTSPMISGTVCSVGDREIVVDTDRGEQVTLVMDSRTMLPTDLAPGMVMKAEFRVMENGQYYVTRIIPIRDANSAQKLDAYMQHHDHDWDASRVSTTHRRYWNGEPSTAAEPAAMVRAGASEPLVAADASTSSHRPETLPQTGSLLPLVGLLGLLALGGAGILMVIRRRARA